MQRTTLALRPPCRARNSFSVAAALAAAFSSNSASPRLRQNGNLEAAQADSTLPNGHSGQLSRYDDLINSAEGLSGANAVRRTPPVPSQALRKGGKPRVDGKTPQRQADILHERTRAEPSQAVVAKIPGRPRGSLNLGIPDVKHTPAPYETWRIRLGTEKPRRTGVLADARITDRTRYKAVVKLLGPDLIDRLHRLPDESGKQTFEGLDPSWKERMHVLGEVANTVAGKILDPGVEDLLRRVLHYDTKIAAAPKSPATRPTPYPWEEKSATNLAQKMDAEIGNFARFIEPTAAEAAARRAVFCEVDALAKQLMRPDMQLELFGSGTTGLATATSDIDMRLYGDGLHPRDYAFRNAMGALHQTMVKSDNYILVVQRHGAYPIVNAQHKATGIDIQIVSSPSTHRQRELTLQYLAELPHLRDLYFVVRTALSMHGLNDVYNGGIGSYGALIMLVGALKRGLAAPLPNLHRPHAQLLHFLDFWADFRTDLYGLTLTPTPKLFLKHDSSTTTPVLQARIQAAHRRGDHVRAGQWAISQRRPLQPYLLCLQDPANPTNDLGRKSNAWFYAAATFGKMRREMQIRSRGQGSKVNWLDALVGRCHEVYFERRKRVEEYGQVILDREAAQALERPLESETVGGAATSAP